MNQSINIHARGHEEVDVDLHYQNGNEATVLTIKITDKSGLLWEVSDVTFFCLTPMQLIRIGEEIERQGRQLAGMLEVQRMERQLSNSEAAAFIGEPLPAA